MMGPPKGAPKGPKKGPKKAPKRHQKVPPKMPERTKSAGVTRVPESVKFGAPAVIALRKSLGRLVWAGDLGRPKKCTKTAEKRHQNRPPKGPKKGSKRGPKPGTKMAPKRAPRGARRRTTSPDPALDSFLRGLARPCASHRKVNCP